MIHGIPNTSVPSCPGLKNFYLHEALVPHANILKSPELQYLKWNISERKLFVDNSPLTLPILSHGKYANMEHQSLIPPQTTWTIQAKNLLTSSHITYFYHYLHSSIGWSYLTYTQSQATGTRPPLHKRLSKCLTLGIKWHRTSTPLHPPLPSPHKHTGLSSFHNAEKLVSSSPQQSWVMSCLLAV